MPYTSRLLRHLEAILKTGSIAAAAKKNFVAQPSLSQYVKRLESEYGIEIFDRTQSPWVLTREGEYLLETERQIEAVERSRRAFFADRRQAIAGRLIIGSTQYRTATLLAKVLPAYTAAFPSVEISIVETSSARLMEQTAAGELDIAIVVEQSLTPEFERAVLFEETVVMAVPDLPGFEMTAANDAKAAMEEGEAVSFAAATHLPFIVMREGMVLRDLFEDLCRTLNVAPRTALVAQSVVTVPDLVEAGLGVALVPDVLANAMTASGTRRIRCLPFKEAPAASHVVVAWNKKRYLSRAAQAFIEMTKTVMAKTSSDRR